MRSLPKSSTTIARRGNTLVAKQSRVFRDNLLAYQDPEIDIIVNEGGARSSKTYSILNLLIFQIAFEFTGLHISIVRDTLSEMKLTVMKDFYDILRNADLYDKKAHNKSEHTYELRGNTFSFIGLDQEHKKRGAGRDILYCNEIDSIAWKDFYQLYIRTTGKIFLDYNPSMVEHWVFDKILKVDGVDNPRAVLIQSTYLDNPFLDKTLRKRIEDLDSIDPVLAAIFKYGKRADYRGLIFPDAEVLDELPTGVELLGYGLDFGGDNSPNALVGAYEPIQWSGEDKKPLYLVELMYAPGLSSSDMDTIFGGLGIGDGDIIGDPENSIVIKDLAGYGWNIHKAGKPPGSVLGGITLLKKRKLYLIGRNFSEERRKYKWKEDKNGNALNVPVDAFNHLWDASRYVAQAFLMEGGKAQGFDPISF